MIGTLYILATPIGNLEDITLRALRVLKEADFILCEDTRTTKQLLKKYDIGTKTVSCHMHSTPRELENVLELLREGKNLALVTDAGTPAISDPGAFIVKKVYEEFADEAKVFSIPGPSALTAALSIAGIETEPLTFFGFAPHKKGRETLFKRIAGIEHTVVLYESPHRLVKALDKLAELLPESREIAVIREISKIHESRVAGSAAKILAHFNSHPEQIRGECVIVIGPVQRK